MSGDPSFDSEDGFFFCIQSFLLGGSCLPPGLVFGFLVHVLQGGFDVEPRGRREVAGPRVIYHVGDVSDLFDAGEEGREAATNAGGVTDHG